MVKRRKAKLKIIIIIIFLVIGILFTFLLNIRSEFVKYIDTKYPELSFEVGLANIDLIYGSYYSRVKCLDDEIEFTVSKSFNTREIQESYNQIKSNTQYKIKIEEIFNGTDIEKDIQHASGGSKTPFKDSDSYEQISIELVSNTNQVKAVNEILMLLKEKNINVGKIYFVYEKDKCLYELVLSSNDFNLTEKEIVEKVIKLKEIK